MLHFSPLKIGVIIAICIAGVTFSLPNLFSRTQMASMPDWLPQGQIALGLDLQGGSQLLLEIGLDAVIEERMESMVDDIRRSLSSGRIEYGDLGTRDDIAVVTLVDPGQAPEALEIFKTLNSDAITPDFEIKETGGGRIEIKLTEAAAQTLRDSVIDQSMAIVRRRIDEAGMNHSAIRHQEGGEGNRILVELPREWDPEMIKHLLEQPAKLSFHLVDEDTPIAEALSGHLPDNSMLYEESVSSSQIVLRKQIEVGGEHVIEAYPAFDPPTVNFIFDSVGAQKFANVTKEHIGARLAIVFDERVISLPRIDEPILGGATIISGLFTIDEAIELAILLRAGALPAPLTVVEIRTGYP